MRELSWGSELHTPADTRICPPHDSRLRGKNGGAEPRGGRQRRALEARPH